MADPLRQCIENFGPAPRKFSLWDRLTYCRIPVPKWLRQDPADELMTLFRGMRSLFRDGNVVWGQIIQANQLLFQEGDDDCPGEFVYSLAADGRADPSYLEQVAYQLGSLKHTKPNDPALSGIAEYLTDEYIRVFGLPVPTAISPAIRCRISTTYFVRKHLPNRRLCKSLLPIVVNPSQSHVAMPLPARYWPQPLVDWWSH